MSQAESAEQSNATNQARSPQPVSRRTAIQMTAVAIAAAASSKAKAERPKTTLGEMLSRRQTGDSAYKSTAIADYHANVAEFGGKVSAPVERLFAPIPRRNVWQNCDPCLIKPMAA